MGTFIVQNAALEIIKILLRRPTLHWRHKISEDFFTLLFDEFKENPRKMVEFNFKNDQTPGDANEAAEATD
jgi:hypothetical protein